LNEPLRDVSRRAGPKIKKGRSRVGVRDGLNPIIKTKGCGRRGNGTECDIRAEGRGKVNGPTYKVAGRV
jgi:hypothetical protein